MWKIEQLSSIVEMQLIAFDDDETEFDNIEDAKSKLIKIRREYNTASGFIKRG